MHVKTGSGFYNQVGNETPQKGLLEMLCLLCKGQGWLKKGC